MKVSELIKDITLRAEQVFGVSDHNNDVITVGVRFIDNDIWQIELLRPTQDRLDCGIMSHSNIVGRPCDSEHFDSIKKTEYKVFFLHESKDLMSALRDLYDAVDNAEQKDFQP
jgi:hypothetical protein